MKITIIKKSSVRIPSMSVCPFIVDDPGAGPKK